MGGLPVRLALWVHLRRTSSRCQRSRVVGVTTKLDQRSLGRMRDTAARNSLSRRESFGPQALRLRTFTWWRRTRISASRSRSLPAGASRRTPRSTI